MKPSSTTRAAAGSDEEHDLKQDQVRDQRRDHAPGGAGSSSSLYVATRDINMQTRLAAVGLPFIEAP